MTELLFSKDSYLKEFDANVVARSPDGREVTLDRTAFYYTSGGQPFDTGMLEAEGHTYPVSEVYRNKENGEVVHKLKEPLPPHVTHLKGRIDWTRRYGHMRHHTALHILSRVALDRFNSLVTGSQIYVERARMDFDHMEVLGDDMKRTLEEGANAATDAGYETRAQELPREEALKNPELIRTQINLVPESVQTIRCVEIIGFDFQACGGTHVKNTAEVGRITITNVESKGQGRRRIEITALKS